MTPLVIGAGNETEVLVVREMQPHAVSPALFEADVAFENYSVAHTSRSIARSYNFVQLFPPIHLVVVDSLAAVTHRGLDHFVQQ